ncbi:MAG: hypothetical protein M3Y56_07265 [Armatimonadota bacterium]|nr:hypothetical protein [Armatimonadota bacterium]
MSIPIMIALRDPIVSSHLPLKGEGVAAIVADVAPSPEEVNMPPSFGRDRSPAPTTGLHRSSPSIGGQGSERPYHPIDRKGSPVVL